MRSPTLVLLLILAALLATPSLGPASASQETDDAPMPTMLTEEPGPTTTRGPASRGSTEDREAATGQGHGVVSGSAEAGASPMEGMGERAPSTPAASPRGGTEAPRLSLEAPEDVGLGQDLTLVARLASAAGTPVRDAPVDFLSPASWGDDVRGEMLVGTSRTDANGVARLAYQVRRSGTVALVATFEGDERLAPARAEAETRVEGDFQLYTPDMPAVSLAATRVGAWVLAGAVGVVWGLYVYVARLVLRISRASDLPVVAVVARGITASRRRMMEALVPLGMQAAIAPIGLGLATIIARSPYTHTNIEDHGPASGYDRTPFAHVAREDLDDEHLAERLPPLLDREVSFAREVLPILLANAGPHVVQPRNSPPPKGVRLDAYEHIMAREGLVVPGKPERSELVDVLVNPAMRMPPTIAPLPDQAVRVIVSWVAQGARDN